MRILICAAPSPVQAFNYPATAWLAEVGTLFKKHARLLLVRIVSEIVDDQPPAGEFRSAVKSQLVDHIATSPDRSLLEDLTFKEQPLILPDVVGDAITAAVGRLKGRMSGYHEEKIESRPWESLNALHVVGEEAVAALGVKIEQRRTRARLEGCVVLLPRVEIRKP